MRTLTLILALTLSPCLNADEIPVPVTAPTTAPVPMTLEKRVDTIETSMVQTFEQFFRLDARLRRIEAALGILPPDHKHQWQATSPAITKKATVSATCSCGAFAYVPFEVKPQEAGK